MTISHIQTSSLDGTNMLQGLQWRSSLLLTFARGGDLSAGPGHSAVLVQELRTATVPRVGVKNSPCGLGEEMGPGARDDLKQHPIESASHWHPQSTQGTSHKQNLS